MRRIVLAVAAALLILATCGACADRWDEAMEQIVYRSPREFPLLSKSMVRDLEARGCRIPQPWGQPSTANVIRGQFARAGQTDTAVLCSHDHESAIVVLWGGPARCPSEFAPAADHSFLQIVQADEIGYSREISTVDIHYIEEHREWYGGPEPQGPPKDGIDDAFVEKWSIVHYCVDGSWTGLQGAD